MHYLKTLVNDCLVIYPDRHSDDRGAFFELYNEHRYIERFIGLRDLSNPKMDNIATNILECRWLQTNCSVSNRNVVRGIHLASYAKLVTCVLGRVWDVVVDLRVMSPTYLKWFAIDLAHDRNAEPTQIYVPPGCGHGFFSYEDISVVVYQQTGQYDPVNEKCINWRDPTLKIEWPEAPEYILSQKDNEAPYLHNVALAHPIDTTKVF